MDKKLLKVIIDIVKNVDAATRPGLAGAHTHILRFTAPGLEYIQMGLCEH